MTEEIGTLDNYLQQVAEGISIPESEVTSLEGSTLVAVARGDACLLSTAPQPLLERTDQTSSPEASIRRTGPS